MKQLVLEKIVVSGFPPINKRCLWLKGNTFYFWFKGAWRSINSEVDINNEYIDEKVSETVAEEITKVVGTAPENFDTLGEVHDYIQSHVEEATARDEDIKENAKSIEELEEKVNNLDPTGSGWTDVQ